MRILMLVALVITGCVYISADGDGNDVSIHREAGRNKVHLPEL